MIYVLEENWDAPAPKNWDEVPELPDADVKSWYDKLKELIERIFFGK